ncbi:unnamed protein product [Gulo gulo]|uniref:Uncharacterized protein n=1 Tax=Gulo gulo TaxID=48420 RepID=A0A9X9MDD5_GULGU|nr:unnamed protein product [Gulo gulo]
MNRKEGPEVKEQKKQRLKEGKSVTQVFYNEHAFIIYLEV